MNSPLVTVNILSYNRKEELRNTLTKVFEQDYKNIEVIVVDNASSDGSPEMVKREFPQVKLIELEKNIGIAGWNKGFEAARGEYVLVLDDDSYPDIGTIKAGLDVFIKDNKTGIVAYNVYNLFLKQSQTEKYVNNFVEFIGCGALINKKVFFDVGKFDQNIFLYAHERDFSIRVLNLGLNIKYLQNNFIYHMDIMADRKHPIFNNKRLFYSSISYLIILKKYMFSCNKYIYYKTLIKFILNRFLLIIYFREFHILKKILMFSLINLKKIKTYNLISEKILARYDYLNTAIFDELFFPRKEIKNKYELIFYYCKTFFHSKSHKIESVKYY